MVGDFTGKWWGLACGLVILVALVALLLWRGRADSIAPISVNYNASRLDWAADHYLQHDAYLLWGGASDKAREQQQNLSLENIRPVDYAGPHACRECHEENYRLWSSHAHRWMNARASEQTVRGDFSGGASSRIDYRGGVGSFYRENESYYMQLSRGESTRVFRINRTLGSRIQQYYLGTLVRGPESADHPYRTTDYVLPFGFELTRQEWVPLVHVPGHEKSDSERDDPFEVPSRSAYDFECSVCHTTHPMGDQMLAQIKRFAAYTPRDLFMVASDYIDEAYPGQVKIDLTGGMSKQRLTEMRQGIMQLLAAKNAVHLGIGCESCHLGAKVHAENEDILPPFFPSGRHVYAAGVSKDEIWGKTAENKNFICSHCHSGERPLYAAGISTWNSTEYTDAMRGHCYHPEKAEAHGKQFLTCVTCHNPHETIGRRWTRTQAADDATCVKCHHQFRDAPSVQAHTHHAAGSTGSACMNCHMPRINEGMGDMVRTHTIFSPTNVKMLEANQPNACNMCHVLESIDWTLGHLTDWYGLRRRQRGDAGSNSGAYSDSAISRNYPSRTKPAAVGWLQNPQHATRLVAADVLLKAKARWALPEVLRTLDDPYFENRLFTLQRLEDYLGIYPGEFGYKPYMMRTERQAPLTRLNRALQEGTLRENPRSRN